MSKKKKLGKVLKLHPIEWFASLVPEALEIIPDPVRKPAKKKIKKEGKIKA